MGNCSMWEKLLVCLGCYSLLPCEVTFEQRFEGGEGVEAKTVWREGRGKANAKVLRQQVQASLAH